VPPRRRTRLILAALLLALPLVAEGLLALLLAHPALVPRWPPLRDAVRRAYTLEDWNVLQADPAALAPDSRLGYRLRPGSVRFANREFDTELRINAAGLRDDEASLVAPDLIVLGDSFALGWGVGQEQSFPQRLEALTGLKVLNAGVPSYGTAREILLLRSLDLSRVRAVIVQYFLNDHGENVAWLEGGAGLVVMSPEELSAQAQAHRERLRYRPFDLLRAAFDDLPFSSELQQDTPETLASTALLVLSSAPELRGLPLVFLELDAWGEAREPVAAALESVLAAGGAWNELAGRLTVLRLADTLRPEDAFVLDPHLRASGHEKVARALADVLAARGLLEPR